MVVVTMPIAICYTLSIAVVICSGVGNWRVSNLE